MKRFLIQNMYALILICFSLITACGPYKVKYVMSSKPNQLSYTTTKNHAHGFGPLLIGGGGLFFMLHPMSPALIDYTGEVQTSDVCPDGFSSVTQYHTFGQNSGAAFLSWLIIFNVYHKSNVDWECVKIPPPTVQIEKSIEDIEEELNKLDTMKAEGLVSDEEYLELKEKIIDKY